MSEPLSLTPETILIAPANHLPAEDVAEVVKYNKIEVAPYMYEDGAHLDIHLYLERDGEPPTKLDQIVRLDIEALLGLADWWRRSIAADAAD